MRHLRLALLLSSLLLTVSACASPPPSHLTRLWPQGTTGTPLLGISTEDGVLALAHPEWAVGDLFEIHFPVGNSYVRDWGRLDRRNDDLAIIRPVSSRLLEGRFATELLGPYEVLYLALRDEADGPRMVPVQRWQAGTLGNFIVPPEGDADELVRTWAGVGLYVERDDRWEIVGILSDLTARLTNGRPDDWAVGYVGIGEISRILPDQVDYFVQPYTPPRPDFEFGVPLQPGDIVLPAEELPLEIEPAAEAPGGRP